MRAQEIDETTPTDPNEVKFLGQNIFDEHPYGIFTGVSVKTKDGIITRFATIYTNHEAILDKIEKEHGPATEGVWIGEIETENSKFLQMTESAGLRTRRMDLFKDASAEKLYTLLSSNPETERFVSNDTKRVKFDETVEYKSFKPSSSVLEKVRHDLAKIFEAVSAYIKTFDENEGARITGTITDSDAKMERSLFVTVKFALTAQFSTAITRPDIYMLASGFSIRDFSMLCTLMQRVAIGDTPPTIVEWDMLYHIYKGATGKYYEISLPESSEIKAELYTDGETILDVHDEAYVYESASKLFVKAGAKNNKRYERTNEETFEFKEVPGYQASTTTSTQQGAYDRDVFSGRYRSSRERLDEQLENGAIKGKRILILHDDTDPGAVDLWAEYLNDQGANAIGVETVEDAKREINTKDFDLIYLDINVDKDYKAGFKLLDIIRAKNKEVPVVAVTGIEYLDNQLWNKGFSGYLGLPIGMDELRYGTVIYLDATNRYSKTNLSKDYPISTAKFNDQGTFIYKGKGLWEKINDVKAVNKVYLYNHYLDKFTELVGYIPELKPDVNYDRSIFIPDNDKLASTTLPKGFTLAGKKILMVDDQWLYAREQDAQRLRGIGATVDVATDKTKTMELLKNNNYDFILLDLWMPLSSEGLEVLKYIRNNKAKDLPVICISGANAVTFGTLWELGFTGFLEANSSRNIEDINKMFSIWSTAPNKFLFQKYEPSATTKSDLEKSGLNHAIGNAMYALLSQRDDFSGTDAKELIKDVLAFEVKFLKSYPKLTTQWNAFKSERSFASYKDLMLSWILCMYDTEFHENALLKPMNFYEESSLKDYKANITSLAGINVIVVDPNGDQARQNKEAKLLNALKPDKVTIIYSAKDIVDDFDESKPNMIILLSDKLEQIASTAIDIYSSVKRKKGYFTLVHTNNTDEFSNIEKLTMSYQLSIRGYFKEETSLIKMVSKAYRDGLLDKKLGQKKATLKRLKVLIADDEVLWFQREISEEYAKLGIKVWFATGSTTQNDAEALLSENTFNFVSIDASLETEEGDGTGGIDLAKWINANTAITVKPAMGFHSLGGSNHRANNRIAIEALGAVDLSSMGSFDDKFEPPAKYLKELIKNGKITQVTSKDYSIEQIMDVITSIRTAYGTAEEVKAVTDYVTEIVKYNSGKLNEEHINMLFNVGVYDFMKDLYLQAPEENAGLKYYLGLVSSMAIAAKQEGSVASADITEEDLKNVQDTYKELNISATSITPELMKSILLRSYYQTPHQILVKEMEDLITSSSVGYILENLDIYVPAITNEQGCLFAEEVINEISSMVGISHLGATDRIKLEQTVEAVQQKRKDIASFVCNNDDVNHLELYTNSKSADSDVLVDLALDNILSKTEKTITAKDFLALNSVINLINDPIYYPAGKYKGQTELLDYLKKMSVFEKSLTGTVDLAHNGIADLEKFKETRATAKEIRAILK
ncbi:MAG: response regulator [bacterium]